MSNINNPTVGDVVGPASAVNNNFAAFDTTTGKLIKDSGKNNASYAPALGADDNYVTDAEKIVIGNTSGTNTGDQVADGVTITGTGAAGNPFVAVTAGAGNVVGPASATDGAFALFDTTTGKLLKDSVLLPSGVQKQSYVNQIVSGDGPYTIALTPDKWNSIVVTPVTNGTITFTGATAGTQMLLQNNSATNIAISITGSSGTFLSPKVGGSSQNAIGLFILNGAGAWKKTGLYSNTILEAINQNLSTTATVTHANLSGTNTGDETLTTITNKIGNPKLFHGVLSRLTASPLPTNLTTQVFTLATGTTALTYYRNGVKTIVNTNFNLVLDDGTGGTTINGSLVSGKYYKITTFVAGDNFSNIATTVRGTTNTTGYVFLATGTTPTTWTNGSSVKLLNASAGTYFIYFSDDAGTLSTSKTPWSITELTTVPCATATWNGTDYAIINDERHAYNRDTQWHEWAHDTIGARYQSGLDFAFAGTTIGNTTFSVSSGNIHDEDIDFAISTQTQARIWYQTGASTYAFLNTLATTPYKHNGTGIQAVNSTGYTLATITASNRFFNYWVYANTSMLAPIHIFAETVANANAGGYTSVANAEVAVPPSLAGLGLSPEWKLLYRVVVNGAGLVQTMKTAYDYRIVSSITGGAVASSTAASVTENNYGNVQTAINTLITGKVDYNLGEKSIILDNTLSADGTWSGVTEMGVSTNYALSFGMPVIFFMGEWQPWDNSTSECGESRFGMALGTTTGTGTESVEILRYGTIRADATFPTLTAEVPVYMGTSNITTTIPSASGSIVRKLGHAIDANTIFFDPSNDYITLA